MNWDGALPALPRSYHALPRGVSGATENASVQTGLHLRGPGWAWGINNSSEIISSDELTSRPGVGSQRAGLRDSSGFGLADGQMLHQAVCAHGRAAGAGMVPGLPHPHPRTHSANVCAGDE